MLTVKHNIRIVDNTVCFSFHTWFAFNSICFCLELVKILPSWNTKNPLHVLMMKRKIQSIFMKTIFFWSWAFSPGILFEAILSVLLNNSHWTNCLGCWILLFTSIEKCCVCACCARVCVCQKKKVVYFWLRMLWHFDNAFGKSLWPLMMRQWTVSAVS